MLKNEMRFWSGGKGLSRARGLLHEIRALRFLLPISSVDSSYEFLLCQFRSVVQGIPPESESKRDYADSISPGHSSDAEWCHQTSDVEHSLVPHLADLSIVSNSGNLCQCNFCGLSPCSFSGRSSFLPNIPHGRPAWLYRVLPFQATRSTSHENDEKCGLVCERPAVSPGTDIPNDESVEEPEHTSRQTKDRITLLLKVAEIEASSFVTSFVTDRQVR